MKDIDSLYQNLKSDIEKMENESLQWRLFLNFRKKVHNYSFLNTLFIYWQRPNATLVMGFNQWNRIGRHVKKNEKGIAILAPMLYKVRPSDPSEEVRTVIKGFKTVYVFDISQTDGDESKIPVVSKGLDIEIDELLYTKLKDAFGKYVEITENVGNNLGTKGYMLSSNGRALSIAVNPNYSVSQKIKTLSHEMSHFFDSENPGFAHLSNQDKEFVAESSAYMFLDFLGIDVSDYSLPYIKSWIKDDMAVFAKLAGRVENVYSKLIESCDNLIEEVS